MYLVGLFLFDGGCHSEGLPEAVMDGETVGIIFQLSWFEHAFFGGRKGIVSEKLVESCGENNIALDQLMYVSDFMSQKA